MVRHRICEYFDSPCWHPKATNTTFFTLPEDIRDRIYSEAGLLEGCTIRIVEREQRLDYQIIGPDELEPPWDTNHFRMLSRHEDIAFWAMCEDSGDADTIRRLKSTSTLIHDDVLRYLLSHNEVLYCFQFLCDLQGFLDLPYAWLRAFRSLTVHLDLLKLPDCSYDWSCHHRAGYGELGELTERRKITPSTFTDLMELWSKVTRRLGGLQRETNVKLKILCDFDTEDRARSIVRSLKDNGVVLTRLRLGEASEALLQELAPQAIPPGPIADSGQPSRFLQLPRELRQLILSSTDLVSPNRRMCFDAGIRFEMAWSPDHCGDGDDGCPSPYCTRREFCSVRNRVYPPCECWKPPTPLFLICKDLCEDARTVFCSSNRFILIMDSVNKHMKYGRSYWTDDVEPERPLGRPPYPTSLDARPLHFIRTALPEYMIPRLRDLELVPPKALLHCPEMQKLEQLSNGWRKVVDFLSPRVEGLKLRISFPRWIPPSWEVRESNWRRLDTDRLVKAVLSWNKARAPGLVDFSVTMMKEEGFQKMRELQRGENEANRIRHKVRKLEMLLRQAVMGDGFDNVTRTELEHMMARRLSERESNDGSS